MSLERAFQAELSYLREAGRSFAERHPALAGMLSERGADPDVERLLQGFAFVSARLRRRIDDAAPELGDALAEWLLPHAVRPQPAATLVEFQPRGLRAPITIPQGARLHSRGSARCTFTTSAPLTLVPLRLLRTELHDTALARPELRLHLELEAGAQPSCLQGVPVRVQLHGEPSISAQLFLWLARHLDAVQVLAPDGTKHELGARSVVVPGLTSRDSLYPWPASAPHSARVLLESFALPAKFQRFELHDLSRAVALAGPSFTLVLRFRDPPPLAARPTERMFRLHCVPSVNLFPASAEPLRTDLSERPQLVRALGLDPSHAEVFSLDSVIGIARSGERRAYAPLHAFYDPAQSGGFYKLERRLAEGDDSTQSWLSLHRDPRAAWQRGEETLSIELTCSNRRLASALQPGDLCEPSTDVPAGVRFENIGTVSPPARPALGSERIWQLLSHLACSRRSLADVGVLRNVLALYATDPHSDDPRARVQRGRIDAIRSTRAETVTRVLGGIAARGSLYEVELDARAFASEGDAFGFGAMLHALFAIDARINSFADLRVTMLPSGRSFRYDAEWAR
ncbi:MAG TPA: type VI secretion system baseplate subunit TssF [Polyangiales bacterium]|nr:type VI secretion system baseplate subunit TssF [Polyangiales bacterium]